MRGAGWAMNSYNEYAAQWATFIHSRDEWGLSPYLDLVVPALLQVMRELHNKRVPDARCGVSFHSSWCWS